MFISILYSSKPKFRKKVYRTKCFFVFFFYKFLLSNFFSESVENIILNKLSHEKFESDKGYRFLIGGIISKKSLKQQKFVYQFQP